MDKIKSFIYLDDYKMYSISSQIFEGMTEYIVKSTSQRLEEKDQQKEKFFSGRMLADIIELQKNETEKKFLHDYSYTLFENKLIENKKVLIIDNENFSEQFSSIENYNFIKVTSRVAFNDTKQVEETIDKFNDLGLALAYITSKADAELQAKALLEQANELNDRNLKSKAQAIIKNTLGNIREIAKSKNLYLEPDYLKHLKFILNYGYNNQFEVQMPFTNYDKHYLFSALLNRDKLKEKEVNIIKKHARLSEKDFTIFGILTQVKNQKEELALFRERNESSDLANMKEAIMNIIFHHTNMEETFIGKLDYEFVIDPIAIYQEI